MFSAINFSILHLRLQMRLRIGRVDHHIYFNLIFFCLKHDFSLYAGMLRNIYVEQIVQLLQYQCMLILYLKNCNRGIYLIHMNNQLID